LKKVFSLALIFVLLLNILGYYGVFLGLEYRNNIAMTTLFDRGGYDESNTVTIRLPLSLPYMTDNTEFERVDGLFEHEGEFYRLVKQKYSNDTLTVVCIKDVENKRIQKALSQYVKTFTDKTSDQQHSAKFSISFIKDYYFTPFSLKSVSDGWQSDVIINSYCRNLIPSFVASIVHPPERG
jgi:hypothetical protein